MGTLTQASDALEVGDTLMEYQQDGASLLAGYVERGFQAFIAFWSKLTRNREAKTADAPVSTEKRSMGPEKQSMEVVVKAAGPLVLSSTNPDNINGEMRQSFDIAMEWQEAELPRLFVTSSLSVVLCLRLVL